MISYNHDGDEPYEQEQTDDCEMCGNRVSIFTIDAVIIKGKEAAVCEDCLSEIEEAKRKKRKGRIT